MNTRQETDLCTNIQLHFLITRDKIPADLQNRFFQINQNFRLADVLAFRVSGLKPTMFTKRNSKDMAHIIFRTEDLLDN